MKELFKPESDLFHDTSRRKKKARELDIFKGVRYFQGSVVVIDNRV